MLVLSALLLVGSWTRGWADTPSAAGVGTPIVFSQQGAGGVRWNPRAQQVVPSGTRGAGGGSDLATAIAAHKPAGVSDGAPEGFTAVVSKGEGRVPSYSDQPSFTLVQPASAGSGGAHPQHEPQPARLPPWQHANPTKTAPTGTLVAMSSPETSYEFVRPDTVAAAAADPGNKNYAPVPTITPRPSTVAWWPQQPLQTQQQSSGAGGVPAKQPAHGTDLSSPPAWPDDEERPSFHLERPATPAVPPPGPTAIRQPQSASRPSYGSNYGSSDPGTNLAQGGAGEWCSCVPVSRCPAAGTLMQRIVTPEEAPCAELGTVHCCLPPGAELLPPQCGLRSNVSLQGVALRPGQAPFAWYPWNAVLLSRENQFLGGGALIGPRHVLTAAHKVHHLLDSSGSSASLAGLKVRVGEWDAGSALTESAMYPHADLAVQNIVLHPQFSPRNLRADVAVLTLAAPPPQQQPHIAPVCLPQQNTDFTGTRCWVSGWGQNEYGKEGEYQRVLKHVDVPVIDGVECERLLRDTRLSQHFLLDQTSFLCAGGEPHKDACTGDGGSPLVCEKGGRWFLAGMVAWGIGCATSDTPGVYVNVASFSNWVEAHMTLARNP